MKLDFHQHRILRLRFSLQFQPDFIVIFSPYQRPLCRKTFGLRGVPLSQKPDANFLLGLRLHVPKHGFVRETLLSGLHHADGTGAYYYGQRNPRVAPASSTITNPVTSPATLEKCC